MAIAEGTSLDVIEVDAASRSKVDEMRELLDRVAYLSAGGAKKVYILDEVHMLSGSAEAALLKTLEEAPEHVVFVLATTDPLKVAPTIRSRTQHFEFTLYTMDELEGHLASVCAQEGIEASPEALAIIARAGAGSMRDSLSLLDQAIAHGAVDAEQVGELFGRTAFERRTTILAAVADEDVAGALVTLQELLDAGHEPRRLTEDLLVTTRDAFLLVSARGRVHVDAPDDEAATLTELAGEMGQGMLVRVLETLGQAVVDMRGTDAADPRLVLEIALVRLARRDAGPPLQALAERVDRLERGLGPVAASPASAEPPAPTPTVPAAPTPAAAPPAAPRATARPAPAPARAAPAPAADATPARKPSLKEARSDRPAAAPAPAPEPAAVAAPDAADAPVAARSRADVDIDDVILAWAAILDRLGPSTKAAMREAQPLALDGPVLTLAVPRAHFAAATGRLKREAENIREAIRAEVGVAFQFKPVPTDDTVAGVVADVPDTAAASTPPPAPVADEASSERPDEPSPGLGEPPPDDDDEYVDAREIANAPVADVAGDSVSMFTRNFDATVVEEVARD